jgi:hypothetical protein
MLTRGNDNRPSINQILRTPIIFAELGNIIQSFLPLTEIEETSAFANSLISEIVQIQCEVGATPFYGIRQSTIKTNEGRLKVSIKPGAEFLVQSEVKALNNGLTYKEETDEDGNTYSGYVNSYDIWEGVGILVLQTGDVFMSELLENQFEGCGRMTTESNFKYWGQHKLWLKDGFGTSEKPSGEVYKGQWKDDRKEGYGICRYTDGSRYQGFWKDDKRHGKGFLNNPDGTETKGIWKNDEMI